MTVEPGGAGRPPIARAAGRGRARGYTVVAAVLSAAGLVLVGLLFLLPFLTVTFFSDRGDRYTFVFDGTDLLTGGAPAVVTPEGSDATNPHLGIFSVGRQPFAIAALALLVAGLFTALIRDRLMRHASALGLAVLIGALVVGAYLWAEHAFDGRLLELANGVDGGRVGFHVPNQGIGLWLMIGTLDLLVIGHAMALARAWDRSIAGDPIEEARKATEGDGGQPAG